MKCKSSSGLQARCLRCLLRENGEFFGNYRKKCKRLGVMEIHARERASVIVGYLVGKVFPIV